MSHLRQLGLVGLLALALACCAGPNAAAQGTITAVCSSGGETQTCNTGWYKSPVSVVWHATPPPMEESPCHLDNQYQYPIDTVTFLRCEAFWAGEEAAGFGFALHVEVTSPTAEAVPERPPDANGWYNHPVAFMFKGQGYSGTASCIASGSSATVTYGGPDALSATVGATCTDPAGKSVLPTAGVHYDSTPPTITAIPSRPPDFRGWYNHPVTFLFAGTDATSGIEACNTVTYAGPDSANAQVVGSCRDRAGNMASLAVPIRYQATPPRLDVQAHAAIRSVLLRWQSNADVEIVRFPGRRGTSSSVMYRGSSGSFRDVRVRDGVSYKYTLTARDHAGNTTVRTIYVTPGPQPPVPVTTLRMSAPPLLRWTPMGGAGYYNVQLYRGTKILSLWPGRASLRLKRAWRFDGHLYRLTPGRYRWYVWPGFGSRAQARYGSLIGGGRFVVVP